MFLLIFGPVSRGYFLRRRRYALQFMRNPFPRTGRLIGSGEHGTDLVPLTETVRAALSLVTFNTRVTLPALPEQPNPRTAS